MADLSQIGLALMFLAGPLIVLFIYLRGHAEKFRQENKRELNVIRSRLANQLVVDFVARSIELIDGLLGQNVERAPARTRLVEALGSDESTEEAIHDIRGIFEELPATTEERTRIKDFTQDMLDRFKEREEASSSYQEGWEEEQKCAGRVIRLMIFFISLGVLMLTFSVVVSSVILSETGITVFVVIGGFLGYGILFTAWEAAKMYIDAVAAQNKFIEFMDSELYGIPQLTSPST